MLAMPMPYQYFHILNIMVCINLIMWGYIMALAQSIYAPLCYGFASLIFMGLMELANQLADPFGDDATDFPINEWCADLVHRAVDLIEENVMADTVGERVTVCNGAQVRTQDSTMDEGCDIPGFLKQDRPPNQIDEQAGKEHDTEDALFEASLLGAKSLRRQPMPVEEEEEGEAEEDDKDCCMRIARFLNDMRPHIFEEAQAKAKGGHQYIPLQVQHNASNSDGYKPLQPLAISSEQGVQETPRPNEALRGEVAMTQLGSRELAANGQKGTSAQATSVRFGANMRKGTRSMHVEMDDGSSTMTPLLKR